MAEMGNSRVASPPANPRLELEEDGDRMREFAQSHHRRSDGEYGLAHPRPAQILLVCWAWMGLLSAVNERYGPPGSAHIQPTRRRGTFRPIFHRFDFSSERNGKKEKKRKNLVGYLDKRTQVMAMQFDWTGLHILDYFLC